MIGRCTKYIKIPGFPYAPLVFTSLAIYLSSFFSLRQDDQVSDDRAKQSAKSSGSKQNHHYFN